MARNETGSLMSLPTELPAQIGPAVTTSKPGNPGTPTVDVLLAMTDHDALRWRHAHQDEPALVPLPLIDPDACLLAIRGVRVARVLETLQAKDQPGYARVLRACKAAQS